MSAVLPRSRSGQALLHRGRATAFPIPLDSGVITGVGTIFEIPCVGRERVAVQVYTTDGAAYTATFVVDGTLKEDSVRASTDNPADKDGLTFLSASTDNDYDAAALATFTNTRSIAQIVGLFGRIRVRCTAFTSGNVAVRIL